MEKYGALLGAYRSIKETVCQINGELPWIAKHGLDDEDLYETLAAIMQRSRLSHPNTPLLLDISLHSSGLPGNRELLGLWMRLGGLVEEKRLEWMRVRGDIGKDFASASSLLGEEAAGGVLLEMGLDLRRIVFNKNIHRIGAKSPVRIGDGPGGRRMQEGFISAQIKAGHKSRAARKLGLKAMLSFRVDMSRREEEQALEMNRAGGYTITAALDRAGCHGARAVNKQEKHAGG